MRSSENTVGHEGSISAYSERKTLPYFSFSAYIRPISLHQGR